jgi:hypothetical protein
MISTQPVHTISKKGGDHCIQPKLTEQSVLNTSIIWFYKMRGIVNSSSIANPNVTSEPRKCIMHFLELRTRFISLHSETAIQTLILAQESA